MTVNRTRCAWAKNEPNTSYHDRECGVPVHDDDIRFEFLILEGAQAGLSWETILKKRDAYRKAFDNFDPKRVARYTAARIEKLMQNAGIVRNRLKIPSRGSHDRFLRYPLGCIRRFRHRARLGSP